MRISDWSSDVCSSDLRWLARRKATQPVGRPTAGSTFRNPPGDHAARLIEHCGLKGHRIGGAEVSTLHANFIITDETAKAADVEQLIAHIGEIGRAHAELQSLMRIPYAVFCL